MESLWEWKWAYWDEKLARFEQTAVWMTDAEACADFWAYSVPRSDVVSSSPNESPVPRLANQPVYWTLLSENAN